MKFADKVIIITGASEGIGRALALHLAPQKPKLILTGRNKERVDSIQAEVGARGAECVTVIGDLANDTVCKSVTDKALEAFGRIDILVNNAGITMWAEFADTTDVSLIDKVMRVNFLSAANCTHYALPHLVKSRGQIVAVASLAGLIGVPGHAIYGASKHAMFGFFNALRNELRPHGVSVTMVAPDFVKTEIHVRGLKANGDAMGKRISEDNLSADKCAAMIAKAIAGRRRIIITSARGWMAYVFRDLIPDLIDYLSTKSVKRHNLL